MTTNELPGLGVPIGVNDSDGRPIHIGDTLDFDEHEWGSPCEFVIRLENGEIQHPGCTSDLKNWCRIVKPWNFDFPMHQYLPSRVTVKVGELRIEPDEKQNHQITIDGVRQDKIISLALLMSADTGATLQIERVP